MTSWQVAAAVDFAASSGVEIPSVCRTKMSGQVLNPKGLSVVGRFVLGLKRGALGHHVIGLTVPRTATPWSGYPLEASSPE